MKSKIIALSISLMMLFLITLPALSQESVALPQEESESSSLEDAHLIYGFRIQSNMYVYVLGGVQFDDADLMIGVGLNDSYWIGLHKYFYEGGNLGAFAGLEAIIENPPHETLSLDPCLNLGFSVNADVGTFLVETLVIPSLEGEPVKAWIGVGLYFKL